MFRPRPVKGSGAGIEPYTEALRALGTTMVSTALIDVDLPLLLCLTGSVLVAAAGAAAADDDDDAAAGCADGGLLAAFAAGCADGGLQMQ